MSADLTQLTADACAPLVGTTFTVRHSDADVFLLVDNIKVFEGSGLRDRQVVLDGTAVPPRQAFAITLVGPDSPELSQGMYDLTHPELGQNAMFLSCFGKDTDGLLYEVVFN
ncbi:hypothetical protein [Pseudooctadecabacter sp.]|uniref:DUF6916 family protein n=1 Tax=Pseudooctadecabacter sp. TaxID=1966338 RepID=UPI0035C865AB